MENIKEKIRQVELLKAKGKDLLNELLVLYNVSDSTELPVTVLDVSNYKTEYAEPTPFKGKLAGVPRCTELSKTVPSTNVPW